MPSTQLPDRFFQTLPKFGSADLLFVIGTSLTVQPFAKLAAMAPRTCPRILINLDFAGDLGTHADDVVLLGKCDAIVRDLCRELGWEDALDREWAKTALTLSPGAELSLPAATAFGRAHRANTILDSVPPHEQVELASGASNGTSTPTAAEWQEKLDAAESLTERLRVALEVSEKVVPLMEDTAITFPARTLSSGEILLGAVDNPPSPVQSAYLMAAATAIAVEGKS